MIKHTDGDKFEAARSLIQDLTFKEAAEEFDRCGVELCKNHMQTLGIINNDGLHTNLGLLVKRSTDKTSEYILFD